MGAVGIRSTVRAAVSRHREAQNLSQKELAERAGVSLDTVVRCEAPDGSSRARAPSLDSLERLARALGVPLAALVDDKPDAVARARALLGIATVPEALRAIAQVTEELSS